MATDEFVSVERMARELALKASARGGPAEEFGRLITKGIEMIRMGDMPADLLLDRQLVMLHALGLPAGTMAAARSVCAQVNQDLIMPISWDLPCLLVPPTEIACLASMVTGINYLGNKGTYSPEALSDRYIANEQGARAAPYLIYNIDFGGEKVGIPLSGEQALAITEARRDGRRCLTAPELITLYFMTDLIHWFGGLAPKRGPDMCRCIALDQRTKAPTLFLVHQQSYSSTEVGTPTCAK